MVLVAVVVTITLALLRGGRERAEFDRNCNEVGNIIGGGGTAIGGFSSEIHAATTCPPHTWNETCVRRRATDHPINIIGTSTSFRCQSICWLLVDVQVYDVS